MPESPDTKGHLPHTPITSPSPMAGGTAPGIREGSRPLSNNASEHSPCSTMLNGRTPSPPSTPASTNQQLPPACGARQLSKLKRFLTTLQQFGSDISPEIGERVRTLVLGLVNSHLSIEEFHAKLQEATNFPLRPFVIPFLKANLPLLQRELLHCARMAKQTPHQYLQKNEHILFNTNSSPFDTQDPTKEFPLTQTNENGKRLSPDRGRENGLEHPAKRHQPISPHSNSRVSPNGVLNLTNGPIRLEDISLQRELREREKLERERVEKERLDRDRDFDRERHFAPYNFTRSDSGLDHLDRFDDDWRHVETMLNCIIGMVDKTRRALAVLQERSMRDHEELSMWMRRNGESDVDLKKRGPDSWNNMRSAEERISDVRRRAEEAVQEVKRQAMLELHKAVAAAESKANDMVTQERAKMERAMDDIRKRTRDELVSTINHQEESSESCWNCGRKASETCSGCNTARYCGSFCQHKDWENHHHVCGKAQMSALSQIRDSPPQTVAMSPRETPSQVNSPSPDNSTSSVKSASRSSTPTDGRTADTRSAEVSREHSPCSTMLNGRTPSPPSTPASTNQQVPPACGARQLSKLKWFLTTLQQIGSDISPEIGERVRTLVLGLVNSHLSIEEFHAKLQEATNFPLRPFVIPFLKANLPLLQRELLHARMAKQTPHQYLQKNEHILFNTNSSPFDTQDPTKEFPLTQTNENGKRLSPNRGRENGLEHPAKRHQPISPHSNSRVSPNGVLNLTNGPIRLEDISLQHELREREKLERERVEKERLDRDRDFDRERHFAPYNFTRSDSGLDHLDRFDDDWRHVETMLNCIIGMVDKTRRALPVLQERSMRDHEELSMWMRRNGESDLDLKKRGPDSWNNMRSAEERISDVRRRAEETVQEVKRQSMLELHKAVAAAESKANDMVTQERAKMERAMDDIRKRTRDELVSTINHQEESSESCWNCGRKASETCSGCNTARYCGSFCQHKDWENHHHVCGKAQMSALSQIRDSPPQTVAMSPRETPSQVNSPSPDNSTSSVKSASRSSTPTDGRTADTRSAEVSR